MKKTRKTSRIINDNVINYDNDLRAGFSADTHISRILFSIKTIDCSDESRDLSTLPQLGVFKRGRC